jgi:hypothetical protein
LRRVHQTYRNDLLFALVLRIAFLVSVAVNLNGIDKDINIYIYFSMEFDDMKHVRDANVGQNVPINTFVGARTNIIDTYLPIFHNLSW